MFETVRNAFKIKDLRNKIFYTLIALVIVRIGSQLPVPGVDASFISEWFNNQNSLDFINQLTGGSLETMSIFALNITPYITASIIIQLLTIAIPKLEELQKDGEEGRKKLAEYTRYVTIALSVIESAAMAIGFGRSGYLTEGVTFTSVSVIIVSLTAGSAYLMWLGEQITDKGVGNGISIILLYNIVSRMPSDMASLYEKFVSGANNATNGLIGAVVILAVLIGMVVFIVILSDGERRINVQYSKKTQGRKLVGGQSSHIPLKVNTAGVIPVIFAGSLFSMPIVVAGFAGIQPASGAGASLGQKILKVLNQNSWCNFDSFGEFKYTLGLVVYIVLLIFFAYFYTSITFNPNEISINMKKQGGFIPGIRPGKPTTDYLTKVLNNIIFIGAVGLSFVAIVPIFFSGAFGADVSFGGTSLIIIVGVVLETLKQIESQMLVRHYRGFISD
ncbi:MAG: preprotein translocase subunit SecY [Lachnospiraceae bacterium]|nr:preprotein translocase subunit SecY [Lachnospiraceae bacterium]MCI5588245.1 preprotein translocase subunit SecY [Lachnospiraceae bacterium]